MPEYVFNNDGEWCYSACTSSLHALLAALMDFSESASPSDAIVIGADALSAIGVMGFSRVGATTKDGCRPFSAMRDGILIGEGAAAIRLRHPSNDPEAVKLLGFGMSCDGCHPTDPDSSGLWLEKAIRDAVRRSGCNMGDIAAIICHGTGTAKSDLVEAAVYERIWPGGGVPVTSIKGALGHSMGVAGLLNVLVAVEVTRTGTVPPTVGSDSEAIGGLDLVQVTPRHIKPSSPILAVASGFGGNNCACVVGVEGP
jgi:3-oxoacyl-(acyl-carrier-protein) synthase